MYYNVIITVVLANTLITSHNYHFFFVLRSRSSLLATWKFIIALLTIITVSYIRFPEFIHLLVADCRYFQAPCSPAVPAALLFVHTWLRSFVLLSSLKVCGPSLGTSLELSVYYSQDTQHTLQICYLCRLWTLKTGFVFNIMPYMW